MFIDRGFLKICFARGARPHKAVLLLFLREMLGAINIVLLTEHKTCPCASMTQAIFSRPLCAYFFC
jgi:hypothetical protein